LDMCVSWWGRHAFFAADKSRHVNS
jgi:hypothetical protein